MGRPKKIETLREKTRVKGKPISSATGCYDILPRKMKLFERCYKIIEKQVSFYSFEKIETPCLENIELFTRAVGEATDIVEKEMLTLAEKDKQGFTLALRPEGTAGVARAFVEREMHTLRQPIKVYYFGPMFRRQKYQTKDFTQFHQFNLEILGSGKPVLDAEVIFIFWKILRKIGITDFEIQINSVGCRVCRQEYVAILKNFFSGKRARLCDDCRKRLKKNPLRLFDCKKEKCQIITCEAPQIMDFLCEECHDHFKEVLEFLDELEITYNLNPYLIRGFDYYTKTVFEFWPRGIEAPSQHSLGGGGRYDDLVELLGGRETKAVGAALNMERVISRLEEQSFKFKEKYSCDVFFAQLGALAKKKSLKIYNQLVEAGIRVREALHKDSIKSQFKLAEHLGAKFVLILGQKEALEGTILLRNMKTGVQELINIDQLVSEVKKRLSEQKNEVINNLKMKEVDSHDRG